MAHGLTIQEMNAQIRVEFTAARTELEQLPYEQGLVLAVADTDDLWFVGADGFMTADLAKAKRWSSVDPEAAVYDQDKQPRPTQWMSIDYARTQLIGELNTAIAMIDQL